MPIYEYTLYNIHDIEYIYTCNIITMYSHVHTCVYSTCIITCNIYNT